MTIDIKSMGYVRVASTDLPAWTTFAGKVLGLAAGRGPNPDHQYWRIDAVSARLVVFPSDVDQMSCVGWEVADHRALQEAREHLQKAGVDFEEGTKEELDERRVQELMRFSDPFDNVFELFVRAPGATSGSCSGSTPEGHGIGLATSKRIIEAHGGRIGFEAVEGPGTMIWFELPA